MELSAKTKQHIEALFSPSERAAAERLLADLIPLSSPKGEERIHFAALRVSHGDLAQLAAVIGQDWRDTLMEAGFGYDIHAHETWAPRRLTPEAIIAWKEGAQIDGVLFRYLEPVKLHRRRNIQGEPAAVIELVALEPEPTFTIRSGTGETRMAFQRWLHPLADRAWNPTGL